MDKRKIFRWFSKSVVDESSRLFRQKQSEQQDLTSDLEEKVIARCLLRTWNMDTKNTPNDENCVDRAIQALMNRNVSRIKAFVSVASLQDSFHSAPFEFYPPDNLPSWVALSKNEGLCSKKTLSMKSHGLIHGHRVSDTVYRTLSRITGTTHTLFHRQSIAELFSFHHPHRVNIPGKAS
jgi:hypothetical protein